MAGAKKLVRVQTGPTSYLNLTEEEAAVYRKEHGEYGATAAKAESAPAENKARTAAPEKKAK